MSFDKRDKYNGPCPAELGSQPDCISGPTFLSQPLTFFNFHNIGHKG